MYVRAPRAHSSGAAVTTHQKFIFMATWRQNFLTIVNTRPVALATALAIDLAAAALLGFGVACAGVNEDEMVPEARLDGPVHDSNPTLEAHLCVCVCAHE